MKQRFWSPLGEDEALKDAQIEYNRKENCLTVCDENQIKFIENDSTFLINAHGLIASSKEESHTVAEISGPNGHMTPMDLAECIEIYGLPKTHIIIRLLVCGAGVGNSSYAQKLAIELGKLGYKDIVVGGYEKARIIAKGGLQKHTCLLDEKTNYIATNTVDGKYIKWFNCSGKSVEKPNRNTRYQKEISANIKNLQDLEKNTIQANPSFTTLLQLQTQILNEFIKLHNNINVFLQNYNRKTISSDIFPIYLKYKKNVKVILFNFINLTNNNILSLQHKINAQNTQNNNESKQGIQMMGKDFQLAIAQQTEVLNNYVNQFQYLFGIEEFQKVFSRNQEKQVCSNRKNIDQLKLFPPMRSNILQAEKEEEKMHSKHSSDALNKESHCPIM